MSTIASPSAPLSSRRRVAGAVVPAVSLVALLATWSVFRLIDDVTQSVSASQVAFRLLIHLTVGIAPLVVLLALALRPPQKLLKRIDFFPFAIGAAVLALAWVPVAMFVTFYFGS